MFDTFTLNFQDIYDIWVIVSSVSTVTLIERDFERWRLVFFSLLPETVAKTRNSYIPTLDSGDIVDDKVEILLCLM